MYELHERNWFNSLVDALGLLSLAAAAAALAGVLWIPGLASETGLFSTFHACLGMAVSSFLVGRLTDIVMIVANSTDPQQLRSGQAIDDPDMARGAAIDDRNTNVITTDKFARAA